MIKQEQRKWCWAACADMILHYYGNTEVRQCDLANWAFGVGGCCNISSSSICDRPSSDPETNRLFSAFGLRFLYTGSNLGSSTLQFEIDLDRPVQVGFTWTAGGGHVVVVVSWDTDADGELLLRINDPAYGSGGIFYTDLLTAGGRGVWDATWTDIRRI